MPTFKTRPTGLGAYSADKFTYSNPNADWSMETSHLDEKQLTEHGSQGASKLPKDMKR